MLTQFNANYAAQIVAYINVIYNSKIDHTFYALVFRSKPDKFGNTPLLEAVKEGHDRVATLLFSQGAKLNLENGSHLCMAVSKGDSDFVRRALAYGADPDSKDYDHRTPLHIAAAEGLYMMAKLLVDAGASVFTTDRYHTTTKNFILEFCYLHCRHS
jgi:hypothetical protein